MRIGLFGGTFNPVHKGHLWAASEVKKDFELDQIFLIPAALPPHKSSGVVASADDRLEMIKIAVADLSGITVSDIELKRRGLSYTIDTVRLFKDRFADGSSIYLIMGLDAFLEIDTWKSYTELLDEIPFIVMARPSEDYSDAQKGWEIMEDYLKSTLSNNYEFVAAHSCYILPGKQAIYICDVQAPDISSTKIRQKVKATQPIEKFVPPQVAEYIYSKGLYK